MSADNYWIIRKDNYGKFVPVMGFDSDEFTPEISVRHPRYTTVEAALDAVKDDYAEYGVSVHPECYETGNPSLLKNDNGHYSTCAVNFPDFYDGEEAVCDCDTIEENWHTDIPAVDQDDFDAIITTSDYAWLNELDDVDRDTFLKEVKAAAGNSVEALVATLIAWKKTADVISNPAVREALLTREFLEEDFVEAEAPAVKE